MSLQENPIGLDGIEFIEFCGPDEAGLTSLCQRFGLTEIGKHKSKHLRLFRQNDINFVVNTEKNCFAADFAKLHGPSVCSTGFRVKDAKKAFETAVARGAKPFTGDSTAKAGWTAPAIYGIGDSLVYFIDKYNPSFHGKPAQSKQTIYDEIFEYTSNDHYPKGKGLRVIDHMTNNVPKGEMQKWCDFYTKVFNFEERRYFDIRGKQTGLFSKVMRSPCGKFSIPINEPQDAKSQIQEYLDEYKGSGIQHIALLADDICSAVEGLNANHIEFLDRPIHTYYEMLPKRVPNVSEDLKRLEKLAILVDGDDHGYLLQIFTKNQVGPVFVEIIQRKKHEGFGDGNFQALFDAMEADQRARGVI